VLKADVIGQEGMLTHPWHLILLLLLLRVRVSLILTVNKSADFCVYQTRFTDFDSGLFRLPNLDTLILTFDFYV
jgi:hypothetical protein